jgi:hypothetical protein
VKDLEQEVKLQTSSSGNRANEVDKYKVEIAVSLVDNIYM